MLMRAFLRYSVGVVCAVLFVAFLHPEPVLDIFWWLR